MRTILILEDKMARSAYNTDGKNAVLDFFKSHSDRQFTADDVINSLTEKCRVSGEKIPGKSSIYRIISNFEQTGALRCFLDSETSKRLYQYAGEHCDHHFHLKCSECGQVVHLECAIGDELVRHISSDHGFSVSAGKSMLLGECEKCRKKKESI